MVRGIAFILTTHKIVRGIAFITHKIVRGIAFILITHYASYPPVPHPLEGGPVGALFAEVLVPRVEVAVEVHQGNRSKLVADRLENVPRTGT